MYDDPSSSRKQPHKDSSSRKQLLKDQYTAYSEKKDYDRHVKEVERQNRKNQEKQSKAEAWLIKKGFTKEEAKRNAAATVLQTSVRGRRVRSGRGISVSAALHEKKEDLNQRVAHKLAHATNHMTFRLVRDWVQSSLRNGVHDDPWLPHGANDQMMVWVDAFLKELNVRMDNEEDEITSVEFKKEMRELININNWPPPPPLWRNPLWWARCRILYALSPADRNSTYSSTVTVGRWMSLLYLLLWMPFGISGPAWLAYLLCVLTVDDEYQLLTFLLRFKAFAYIMWGVVPIVIDWITFYGAVIEGDFTRRRARDAGGEQHHPGDLNHVCITGGPSTTTIDQFSDHCFILTWFLGYVVCARYKWLRRAHLSGRARSVWTGDMDHGDHEVQAVMVWDGLTTLVFTLLTSGILFYVAGADSNLTWFSTLFRELAHVIIITPGEEQLVDVKIEMYMVSLYTTLLGLFSMPWLVFAIPGVGGLLHQMRPTGFDEAGGLKLQMNLQQMKRKQKRLMHANLLGVEEAELLYAHVQALPELGVTARARSAARDLTRDALKLGGVSASDQPEFLHKTSGHEKLIDLQQKKEKKTTRKAGPSSPGIAF